MSDLTDAQMSWQQREYVRTRLAQLDRNDADYAIMSARLILADLPAEPPPRCARRRQLLEAALSDFRVKCSCHQGQGAA